MAAWLASRLSSRSSIVTACWGVAGWGAGTTACAARGVLGLVTPEAASENAAKVRVRRALRRKGIVAARDGRVARRSRG
jgi:hypothetical protein